MTARQAMQRLAEDGLIERIPGRGSFAAERPTHRHADRLLAFSDEMRRLGRRPSSRLIERLARPATEGEATALRIHPGDEVVVLRRIRLGDGEPVAIETATLAGSTAGAVLGADLEAGSLHEALRAAGVTLRRGHATITAEPAGRDDAALLGIAAGEPLLVERRVIVDGRGRPVETTESRYPGDRYALDVRFEIGGTAPGEGRGTGRGTFAARHRS
jgi:GntR family transcriptional regulator